MLEFFTDSFSDLINLILLRWYNEVDGEEMYGYLRLWLTEQYTCVYLDSVDMSVHIIPRSKCENEYFVNTYMF